MRPTIVSLFLALTTCASAALAQVRSTTATSSVPSNPIYITRVTVLDTETGKETPDQTVIISGNRISDIRNSKRVKPPANATVVEGRGKFLIPGLWDMHAHAFTEERFGSMFPMFIANGVLGIRDMSSTLRVPSRLLACLPVQTTSIR